MLPFLFFTLVSIISSGALATPTRRDVCMSYDDADLTAKKFAELLTAYSDELATNILLPDFADFSESVNTLINTCPEGPAAITVPLLGATFSSRDEFMQGQGKQPPIDFERLQLWHSCQSVFIRWLTTNTAPIPDPKPVVGIIVLETQVAPAGSQYPWLIDRVYSEFDSGAWVQNLVTAGLCPPAGASPPVVSPPSSYPASPQPMTTFAPTWTSSTIPTSRITAWLNSTMVSEPCDTTTPGVAAPTSH